MTADAVGLLLIPEGWTYEMLRALRLAPGARPDPIPSSDVTGVRIPSIALATPAPEPRSLRLARELGREGWPT